MLGLILGGAAGLGVEALLGVGYVISYFTPILIGHVAAWIGFVLASVASCGTLPMVMVPTCAGLAALPPVIGGGIGFLTQLLGPNAVMDVVSGTMGACVVCMDSVLDCVSVMTAGILGPCMGMVGGMGGAGAAMPAVGGEAAGGDMLGGLMDMCTSCIPGMGA